MRKQEKDCLEKLPDMFSISENEDVIGVISKGKEDIIAKCSNLRKAVRQIKFNH